MQMVGSGNIHANRQICAICSMARAISTSMEVAWVVRFERFEEFEEFERFERFERFVRL